MINVLYLDTEIFQDKEIYNKCFDLISKDRKEKIRKLKNPIPARLSLGAGVLLRFALENNDLLSELDNIHYEDHGKPYLKNNSFYFNLSHSGKYVVCAYGNHPIGIDIQKIKEELPKHTKKILSKEEQYTLDQKDISDKKEFFYRLWTRKESLIKWDGRGLRIPLEDISVIQNKLLSDLCIFKDKVLHFFELDLFSPEYTLCICSEEKDALITLNEIDAKFLTKY